MKERSCNMNYPVYPNMGIPMGGQYPNMPMMGMPNMSTPNMGITQNSSSEQINKLEQRVNMLERRISALEGNSTSYSNSSYQML